jgi:hypothetical protein
MIRRIIIHTNDLKTFIGLRADAVQTLLQEWFRIEYRDNNGNNRLHKLSFGFCTQPWHSIAGRRNPPAFL